MVSAAGGTVTNSYIVSKIFAGFGVDVAGKPMRFPARGTGKTAVFAVIGFENVSIGHEIIFF